MTLDYENIEFADNPEPRCPCVLLLDTSGSMSGQPISELNSGINTFEEELKKDKLAALRVEVAIITFGPVSLKQDFVTASQFNAPLLQTTGATPTGEAINFALDRIEDRKKSYKTNGIAYYRPWIFMITDGAPTDYWQTAATRIHEAEANKKVAFFAVGVEGADMGVLQQIASRTPLKLKGLSFKDMFVWLSSSLTSVSHSRPGDEVPLQTPTGWGEV